MGKKKSVAFLVLVTLLIIGLCFVCTVSFHYGTDGMYTFNSIGSMVEKDQGLGGTLPDGETYLGGGYSAVYTPECVLPVSKYEEDLAPLEGEERDEYVDKYTRYPDENGSVYIEKDMFEDGKLSSEFLTGFDNAVKLVQKRLEGLKDEDVRLDVGDDFTMRVFLPENVGSQSLLFNYFSYTGEFEIRYGTGTDASTATALTPTSTETILDYIKGASSMTRSGTSYISIRFTDKGRKVVKDWTSGAADTSGTLYVFVGGEQVIGLSVSEEIDQSTLYINNPTTPFTPASAAAIALTVDTAIHGAEVGFDLRVENVVRHQAQYGGLALTLLYCALGVLFAGMLIFFFVRYHLLAFVHLYTYLLFFFLLLVCAWAIPFVHIGVDTVAAFLIASILLSVSDAVAFEYARKEYASNKPLGNSVKIGYSKCFWSIFDIHVVVLLFAFFTYFVALTQLSAFSFFLGFATAFSALGTLAVNRFLWAVMRSLSKRPEKFCNFKRGAQA